MATDQQLNEDIVESIALMESTLRINEDPGIFDPHPISSTQRVELIYDVTSIDQCLLRKKDRYDTFTFWPRALRHLIDALVDSGFYYTKIGDRVRCVYCNKYLNEWALSDDPWEEHARYSPNCEYVIAKMGEAYVQQISETDPWSSEKSRFQTFIGSWPKYMVPSPKILSSMGFYCLKEGSDAVQCHSCNLILKDWDPSICKDNERLAIKYIVQRHATSKKPCEFFYQKVRSLEGLLEAELSAKIEENYIPYIDGDDDNDNDDGNSNADNVNVTETVQYEADDKYNNIEFVQKLKTRDVAINANLSDECLVCYSKPMSIVFEPCYHYVSCVNCAFQLKTCPICRHTIEQYRTIYKA